MHLVALDSSSGVGVFLLFVYLVILAIAVLYLVALWRIFTKAGKPGWAIFIPIYNTVVLFNITGRSGWWFLALMIPGIDVVVLTVLMYDLARSFGRGLGTALGLIFLGPIFILVLGYGSQYVGPAAVAVPALPAAAPVAAYR